MARSKSSKRWLEEHFSDPYVKKAQEKGYRSRAIFKLEEIQTKFALFKPGMLVVDLGAAPGGWSQMVAHYLKGKGRVYSLDILPMDSLPDVDFIQGDFTSEAVEQQLLQLLDGKKIDVVMSDMAPNLSGVKVADQAKMMYLVELAWDFAKKVLVNDGVFITKIFQGAGSAELIAQIRQSCQKVNLYKPKSSRSRSAEVYVIAQEFKGF